MLNLIKRFIASAVCPNYEYFLLERLENTFAHAHTTYCFTSVRGIMLATLGSTSLGGKGLGNISAHLICSDIVSGYDTMWLKFYFCQLLVNICSLRVMYSNIQLFL